MFKVGDKVKVINPNFEHFGYEGIIKDVDVVNSDSMVDFGKGCYWCHNENLGRVDDMNISERLSEVIKENQNLKQQLSEQNFKLDKIKADINRELRHKHGVSDEEFREAYELWNSSLLRKRKEIWGVCTLLSFISEFSLSEFVNKYKEYKDKQDNEIKVGDEVIVKPNGYNAMVIAFATQIGQLTVFTKEHNTFEVLVSDIEKTGRHFDFDSIDEFMNN